MKKEINKKTNKTVRGKMTGWVMTGICLIVGILLLACPDFVDQFVKWVLFVICLAVSGYCFYKYFTEEPKEALKDFKLSYAIIAFLIGLALMVSHDVVTFVFQYIWGVLLVLAGIFKLQATVDFLRLKISQWRMLLAVAALSLILGFLCLLHPFAINEHLNVFVGISLLAEAVSDGLMMILVKKNTPPAAEEKPAPEQAAPEADEDKEA